MTTIVPHDPAPPAPDVYDAHYYGHTDTPTANYRGYGTPDWAEPLAAWLYYVFAGPYLDIGCAFGHLVAAINRLARLAGTPDQRATGVEWSPYAVARSVAPLDMLQVDGRTLPIGDGAFGCTVSMDYLEHFEPPDSERAIAEAVRVTRPGGYTVHLIGAHNHGEDLSRHLSDPTHRNHLPLRWYVDAFRRRGCEVAEDLTEALNRHPLWARRDWNGRWVVLARGGTR